jgi:hypothetical protein
MCENGKLGDAIRGFEDDHNPSLMRGGSLQATVGLDIGKCIDELHIAKVSALGARE